MAVTNVSHCGKFARVSLWDDGKGAVMTVTGDGVTLLVGVSVAIRRMVIV